MYVALMMSSSAVSACTSVSFVFFHGSAAEAAAMASSSRKQVSSYQRLRHSVGRCDARGGLMAHSTARLQVPGAANWVRLL